MEMADSVEATQLNMARELLAYASGVLNRPEVPSAQPLARSAVELRWLAGQLTHALSTALRVADSRGAWCHDESTAQ